MSGLAITGLKKRFGETDILKGISLTVKPGEFLSLVGPSGCGKTTLMRIVAGLETATAGDVAIDGKSISHLRAADRDIAMVFQSYALYPHLNAAANMAVPLIMRELNGLERMPFLGRFMPGAPAKYASINERVDETARLLDIAQLKSRKPGEMSGGQRQRVALGRAMIRRPRAFLMDEPLSNLDAVLRVQMRREIVELHRRVKATTIYVTHDQTEAMTMSDRVALMMGGELVQLGAPEELYTNPDDIRTARFIGTPRINLIRAERDEDVARQLAQQFPHLADPRELTLGIRPQHLSVTGSGVRRIVLACRSVSQEYMGAESFAYLETKAGEQVTIRLEPGQRLEPDAQGWIHLGVSAEDVLLFDKSGKRVRSPQAAAGGTPRQKEAAVAELVYG
jgi:multiple sugar transport system ATP-binding protein